MSEHPVPGWYTDPFGRFQHRYWNGSEWTEHVGSSGLQWTDPPVGPVAQAIQSPTPPSYPTAITPIPVQDTPPPASGPAANKIQRQVAKLDLTNSAGPSDAAILHEPIRVINQRGKLVELKAEYSIYDQDGHQLAAVRGKRMSSRMQVVDMSGRLIFDLRREASLISSKITIASASGAKIGRIVPSKNLNRASRDFKLEGANNQLVGEVFVEDRQRRRDFNVQDTDNNVVARIAKTRASLAKELFTKGDNYVLNFNGSPADPLRTLSIATALVIDAAFHQQ